MAKWFVTCFTSLLAALTAATWAAQKPQPKPQPKPMPSVKSAEEMLKPTPRPKKGELPGSKLPLQLIKGERIALVGNSMAERMNLFGHFETLLHSRFPDKELVVRNFARPADEVGNRQRSNDYTRLDDPLYAFNPDTFLCFFGFNESFAGSTGAERFIQDYEKFLDEYAKKYPRDDAGSPPRFVLIAPIAFESTGDPLLPDATPRNLLLRQYADYVKSVAQKRGLAVVDVMATSEKKFNEQPGKQFTINGCHVNEEGDRVVSELLDAALFGSANPGVTDTAKFEKLRAAVNQKSWIHLQDYRMLNGWYVYGGRRTYDTETFPREYVKIRKMASVRDRYVWDIAQGKQVPASPDDSNTGELIVPPTRFGQVQKSERSDGPRILPPDELIKSCEVPPGFEIKLFADEKRFPELAKPVQLTFDSRGRLWVATMPTYPQWRPGDPPPADKILILEDKDGDGRADSCTVFYDKLHCPTGFEFFDGGVLVMDQPRLLFLKDTNGDDKADQVVHVLDGWATEDTHHTAGAFEMSHGGRLHMLEGIAMSTTLETPWGPFRNFGSSGAYVLDPRTWKVEHFNTPGYGNPWCYVFNEWGQGICGDGTGANQHWDTPLSGAQFIGRKGLNPVFNIEGMRPVVGSEFLYSRNFPDDVQGQFIYACVINMNGIPRWRITDDGGGYRGERVRHDPKDIKTPFDLIKSTDKHFRPVDPQIGPDGALWFGDWANPLIGHMQYSQRDPNRDHVHGRIYRLVYKNKSLVQPVLQQAKSIDDLLEQLREYEWRTRYRVRRELQSRPREEVLAAVDKFVAKLQQREKTPEMARLLCEALWLQQSWHAVQPALVKSILELQVADARAAAIRVVADERDYLPQAISYLKAAAKDEHPRVRTEAVRGLSHFPTTDSTVAVLESLKQSTDYHVSYTAEAALAANLRHWQPDYLKGELAKNDPAGKKLLDGIIAQDKKGAHAIPYLQTVLGKEPVTVEQRNRAMQALAFLEGGNAENGKAVFRRNCIACHRVFNEGADYGPQMDGSNPVGKRLNRFKIVESILDPNAEVEAKYLSTLVATVDGKIVQGLLVSDTKEEVVIFDGKERRTIKVKDIEERKTLKQSSMPEGMAGSISPVEFLDLVAFLAALK